jgi:type IV pilus assembly protein PilA
VAHKGKTQYENIGNRVIFKTFFRRLKMRKKRQRRGFTLIELMVVILIVGILAAVAIPLMRGRIDAAKWSEGKAMMGTIATALRAYGAEKGDNGTWPPSMTQLGFVAGDLTGTYFVDADFTWGNAAYDSTVTPSLTYTISCTPSTTTLVPATVTLTHLGVWAP